VLAVLKGEPVSQVSAKSGICQGCDLYNFRKRALTAMRDALGNLPRGPKIPYNRLSKDKEDNVKSICERYTTLSSYKIKEKIG
jgi:hypothetical protein